MGNSYALALSQSMKYLKANKVELPGNRINNKGATAIFSNLSDKLTYLNLSNNNIGIQSMPYLVNWMDQIYTK
jgi:hypothetical protein